MGPRTTSVLTTLPCLGIAEQWTIAHGLQCYITIDTQVSVPFAVVDHQGGCREISSMDDKKFDLISGIIGKSYGSQAQGARKTRAKMVTTLLAQVNMGRVRSLLCLVFTALLAAEATP